MNDSDEKVKTMKKGSLFRKASVFLSAIAGIFLIAFLIHIYADVNVEVYQSRNNNTFTNVSDYTCEEIQCDDAPIGIKKVYTFSLDNALENDTNLAFYTVHQYAEVFMEDELIYSLKPSRENSTIKTVGCNWTMVPVYREDAGKKIRVEITPVYESFRNREVVFLTGSALSIFAGRLMRDMPQLLLSIAALLVGFVFICIAVYCMFRKQYSKRLAALGIFSVMMGLWRLTDTRFTPFMFPDKPVLMFYISVGMLMLGVVSIIKSSKDELNGRSQCILDIISILASMVCILQLLLQISGIADIRENLFITHTVIIISSIVIIGNIVYDRLKYPEKYENSFGRKLYIVCILGVLADIVYFYTKGNSSGLIFSLASFELYVFWVGISMIINYGNQEKELALKEKMLAENERKLAENRISVMLSQIRPHFLNNSLTSIAMLCEKDPQRAEEAVIHLAEYLRENMNSLKESRMINFSEELSHTEHYLFLEKLRFGDSLEIIKDIETTDFMVPPLSVQPLVENAVKHGLKNHRGKGVITIKVRENEKSIVISISDNGRGFDKSSLQNETGEHIGLENVRQRLKMLASAKLEIDSTEGMGTNAVISIPKEK